MVANLNQDAEALLFWIAAGFVLIPAGAVGSIALIWPSLTTFVVTTHLASTGQISELVRVLAIVGSVPISVGWIVLLIMREEAKM